MCHVYAYIFIIITIDLSLKISVYYIADRKNKFGLLGVHIKPDDAEKEIGYLTRVYNDAKRSKYFNTEVSL